MYPRLFKSLAMVLATLSLAGFAFTYLIVPMQSFQSLFGETGAFLESYLDFLICACLLALGGCLLMVRVFHHLEKGPFPPPPAKKQQITWSSRQKWIPLIFSLLIIGQSLQEFHTPLGLDENQKIHEFFVKNDLLFSINPLRGTEVHSIAHLFSFLSMKWLGYSEFNFRLPAVLFTFIFMIALNLFSWRLLSPTTSYLLFAHLAANQFVIWYTHSTRGYISSMALTLIPLAIVLNLQHTAPDRRTLQAWLYSLFFGLSVLGHPFAGMFVVLLFFGLLQWLAFNVGRIDRDRYRFGCQLVWLSLLMLPLVGVVFLFLTSSLADVGDLHATEYPAVAYQLGRMTGLGLSWMWKLGMIFLATTAIFWALRRRYRNDILTLFLLNICAVFGLLFSILGVTHTEGRWFLIFLVPFVIWIGRTFEQFKWQKAKWLYLGCAIVLFVIFPYTQRRGVKRSLLPFVHFAEFIEEAKRLTGPVSKSCYVFPESDMVADWAREYYFRKGSLLGRDDCRGKPIYYLYFGRSEPLSPPIGKLKKLYTHHLGNESLYKLIR